MLTGRKNCFINPEEYSKITGYTEPRESSHDFFAVGHTSTSVSLACGLQKARDFKGDSENIIAVIGDGSLSGGEAYEGLNNAAESGKNIIIVVNDNDMSIAENHGGLYKNLAQLRATNGQAENNFFKAMGLDYCYVEEGNNVRALIDTFTKVKDIDHPIVVHIHTVKGKGYEDAEVNKEAFHWVMPFDFETKKPLMEMSGISYRDVALEFIMKKAASDKTVVAINAATPGGFGFYKENREKLGSQYVDVGIAEEHAVALASGIASQGAKPILCFSSSFVQRTYDQLLQDLAINNNPALILVYNGAISGMDVTHLGIFDIPLISNIPNIVYLAPTSKEELLAMMEWGLEKQEHPVVVRIPKNEVISAGKTVKADFSDLNKYVITESGKDVAIVALGSFHELGKKVREELKKETGIDATLINPRFITGIDKEMLENLKKDHKVVITLEDGLLDGGFGEKITRFYGNSDMKVLNFGAHKEFTDKIPINELLKRYHLTKKQIVEDIQRVLYL